MTQHDESSSSITINYNDSVGIHPFYDALYHQIVKGTNHYVVSGGTTAYQNSINDKVLRISKRNIFNKTNFPDNEGVVWIKREFSIPAHLLNRPLSLFIEEISTADETYINEEYIGRTGLTPYRDNHYFSSWNNPRHYSIPQKLLTKNKNIFVQWYITH